MGHRPCVLALIEAKADVNAKDVSCSRVSATLKSVQLIQTTQIRFKTPSYVVVMRMR
jgi:hypothetical protein